MRKTVERLVVVFLTVAAALVFGTLVAGLIQVDGAFSAACLIFLIGEVAVCTHIILRAMEDGKKQD